MYSNSKSRIFKALAFSLFLLPTLYLATTSYTKGDFKELKIGKKMPLSTLKMESVSGEKVAMSDLKKDNGTVIVFSCNTCPFVVGNDNFDGWEHKYNDLMVLAEESSFGFVLINSNEAKREGDDSMDAMKAHAEEAAYKMLYLVDEESKLANAFGARTTPHVFVFDNEDKLAYKGAIDNSVDSKRESDENYLIDAINAIVKNEKIKTESTPPRGCSIKRK